MILLAFWILLVSLVCYLIGRWGLHGLARLAGGEVIEFPGFGPVILIGLALITLGACLVSLAFPLSAGAALLLPITVRIPVVVSRHFVGRQLVRLAELQRVKYRARDVFGHHRRFERLQRAFADRTHAVVFH